MTTAIQLASVRAAIANIEGGAQSVRGSDGRGLTNANLADLYEREGVLMARLSAETRAAAGGGRNRIIYAVPD